MKSLSPLPTAPGESGNVVTAADAVRLIRSGDTIATSGTSGVKLYLANGGADE